MLMPNFQLIDWAILIVLSLILPLSIFFGRGSIRKRRLAVLKDLEEKAFKVGRQGGDVVLPSLELVRARYEQAQFGGSDSKERGWGRLQAYSVEIVAYTLPTSIFVIITLMGFYLLLSAVYSQLQSPHFLLIGLSGNTADPKVYQTVSALIISAGFLGAYIWSINYLILRVANFDLTPLDFLRVSAHILLTAFIVGVFRHFVGASTGIEIATATLLVAAFVMGLVPSLGLNTLIDRLPPSFRLKRVVEEANKISREFPLDLIDGIDSGIKFRLANYEINDVQNLATENPISLYVSTPYNFVEILDWIAQAQLMISVGPSKYLELRKSNIRDIFGLLDVGATPQGVQFLKSILLDSGATDELMDASLKSIESSLYVQRLIRLREVVASSLEARARPALRVAAE
jgi:hypothetical protein